MTIVSLADEELFLTRVTGRAKRRRLDSGLPLPVPPELEPIANTTAQADTLVDIDKIETKALAYGKYYSAEEQTLRPNLSQEFVNDSARRPQNYLLHCDLEERFNEYPKLKKLLQLHSRLVEEHAIPSTYLQSSLRDTQELIATLSPNKFDCILIDKPDDWTWDDIATLPIPTLSALPSFIWIWCGQGNDDGLERGRELLARWGYRRCEDVVWLKTTKLATTDSKDEESTANDLFVQSKEHCLQGIRGTVRRSTDADVVHCNVDTDVIVWEGDPKDPRRKPVEMHTIIENFSLGNRRLELFGSPENARKGWLTIGTDMLMPEHAAVAFDKADYAHLFLEHAVATSVPNTPDVDALRPKSPPIRGGHNTSGGGIGMGRKMGSAAVSSTAPSFHQNPIPPQGMPNLFNPMMHMPMPMSMPMQMPPMPMSMPMPMPMPMGLGTMPMDWTSFFANQQQHKP